MIGASPLISAIFHDEPTIETMNRLGMEFNAVGNHEFDEGKDELLRMQNGGCHPTDPNSCQGASVGTPTPFEGAKFNFLAANVVESATGKTVFPAYMVKNFHVGNARESRREHDKNNVKVAFIGMTLRATPTIVTPTGVAGLDFKDEAETVNALVPKLRKQGVEAIVVLVHQGGFQGAGYFDINGCDGNLVGSDIASIVGQLDDAVDLVISGHTHGAYNCSANTVDVQNVGGVVTSTPRPTGLPNKAGRLIPITSASAFGRVLTDIDLSIDTKTGDVTHVAANNVLVDRTNTAITPVAAISDIVNHYNSLVSPVANQVIGSITTDLTNSNGYDAACNMPAGDLIADAQLAATAPSGFGDAVIAFMNRGGVRNPGFVYAQQSGTENPGDLTYSEAFTVQPFGNSLVTMTLTAQDIKNVLEQQFAGCRGQSSTATRIMIPSKGFNYTWDGSKACDSRISNVTLTNLSTNGVETLVDANGAVLNPSKTYRVTVNNFMSTGGDGFSTFLNGTNLLGGAQDVDALVAYMANFKSPNLPYNPSDPVFGAKPRIKRVGGTACPTGANTNP
jgi:5'-nucleotidase